VQVPRQQGINALMKFIQKKKKKVYKQKRTGYLVDMQCVQNSANRIHNTYCYCFVTLRYLWITMCNDDARCKTEI